MFETLPASDRTSRRALLDQIPSCDAYLLLLGAEYGEPGQSGVSPTEEEFEEALRSGLPILALVLEGVDREPRQQEFVNRVRGTWEEGRFAPTFTNSTDVVTAVVSALNGWRNRVPDAAQRDAAVERVRELARRSDRLGMTPGGAKASNGRRPARPPAAPRCRPPHRQRDGRRGDRRRTGLRVNQPVAGRGAERRCRRQHPHQVRAGSQLRAIRGRRRRRRGRDRRGAGWRQQRCHASLGWMVVMDDRIPGAVSQGLRFTEAVWHAIDTRGDIDQVLLSAAVSGAHGKSYSFEEPGNRVSMGSSHSVPDLIVVPAHPLLVRRQDLTLPENATRLQAEIRRRFEAAGAVNAG
jgi:hypothetical protein